MATKKDMAPTWANQLREARKLARKDMDELKRHASVSSSNNHRCQVCFCCAALTVLEIHPQDEPTVIVPTIHLNGTSGARLLADLNESRTAARKLIDTLGEAAPNARDYYPQGPDAFGKARAAHCERVKAVTLVLDELDEIHSHLVDVTEERRRSAGRALGEKGTPS